VRAFAHRECGLGRDQDLVAAALDRCAQDLFGRAVRIDVGGIEQRDAGVETDVDQFPSLLSTALAPGGEERAFTAKSSGAEALYRDLQARGA